MVEDRKLRVLFAIIDSHFLSGDPVGSRRLSKDYDFGVGSATIRNEMSDLEEKGYLNKPHTSAGRLPSDKAYRLYVDSILADYKLKTEGMADLKNQLSHGVIELGQLIENATKILSEMTNYTSMALGPEINSPKLKKLELVKIGNNKMLIVIISDLGYISNCVYILDRELSAEDLKVANEYLNKFFIGLNGNEIKKLVHWIEEDEKIRNPKLLKLIKDFSKEIDKALLEMAERDFFYDGLTKILNHSEYEDFQKTKDFFLTMENEEIIKSALAHPSSDLFEISIGYENENKELQDMSIITVKYSLRDESRGRIGVIGPKRMDYLKNINTLGLFSSSMTEALKELFP